MPGSQDNIAERLKARAEQFRIETDAGFAELKAIALIAADRAGPAA